MNASTVTAPGAPASIAQWSRDWTAEQLLVVVHHRTDAALFVSVDSHRDHAFWLPASLVIVDKIRSPSVWAITIPAWLAKDRGLGQSQKEAHA